VSVYGVLPDGRVTYTALSPAGRLIRSVHSDVPLSFQPKAMATLNFNTLLVTSTSGQLWRVDIGTNRTHVRFDDKLMVASGWTHDKLTFDGRFLYGTAGDQGMLRRYRVTADKPQADDITDNTLVADSGFVLKTLSASAPGWIIGTSLTGKLISYQIGGDQPGPWSGHVLRDKDWGSVDRLFSPGGGFYFAQTGEALWGYRDVDPTDGNGDDLSGHHDPLQPDGWTQTLLSAQPFNT
jgi:hypothetical protein